MKDTSEKGKKAFLSEWLEKLQQESWQLELIISGFAIYGLFQSQDFIRTLSDQLWQVDLEHWFFGHLHVFEPFIEAAWLIFVINLLVHVFVRGLWIGAIGLRYVSGQVDFDSLRFSPKFDRYYRARNPSFDKYIEFLEKLASILFSFSFLLVFIFLGLSFFLLLFSIFAFNYIDICFWLLDNWELPSYIFYLFYYSLIALGFVFKSTGLIVLFDLLSFGKLQKINNSKWSIIYYPIFRFYSLLTLSFLWRPLLLNYVDNSFARRFLIIAIPYIILMFLIGSMVTGVVSNQYLAEQDDLLGPQVDYYAHHSYTHTYYEEDWNLENMDDYNYWPFYSIPSKEVSGAFVKVFVPHQEFDGELIPFMDSTVFEFSNKGMYFEISDAFMGLWMWKPFAKSKMSEVMKEIQKEKDGKVALAENMNERDSTNSYFDNIISSKKNENLFRIKKVLTDIVQFSINDHPIEPSRKFCDFYKHPISNVEGLLCFVQLDSLGVGRHYLTVTRQVGEYLVGYPETEIESSIPFIYMGK